MIHIKNANTGDIPVIRDLCMKVWPQTYMPILGKDQVAYMLDLFYTTESLEQQMGELTHRFMICSSDGVPAAFAAFSEIEPQIFKLHKLYILPGLQGKGIGRFLIFQIIEEIKSKGATALRLNVNRYNYSALAFYSKTGFKLFAEEDIDIGAGYFMNDFVLTREINPDHF